MNTAPDISTSMTKSVALSGGASPTILDAIEAILGKATFVDMTFPRCAFSFMSDRETSLAFLPGPDQRRIDFLNSFRQHGGRHPVGVLPPTAMTGGFAGLCRSPQPGRALVCVGGSIDLLKLLASSRGDEPLNVLLPVPVNAAPEMLPSRLGLSSFNLHCFVEAGDADRLWLLYCSGALAGNGQQAPDMAMQQSLPEARTILPVQSGKQVIAARQFIHDGGYQAEGDDSYSWLWTGPERCFRMIVPRPMDQFPARLEVSIIRAESRQNLDNICVHLDGRVVPFVFDRWSENSGKIVVNVDKCADYTVLGLVIPKLDTDKNNGRVIGVCVDKLILLPD